MRKPAFLSTLVCALVAVPLLAMAPLTVQDRPQSDAKPLSGSYAASCLVRISTVGSLTLDDDTVSALLNSTGVLSEAVREVLGRPASRIDDVLNVSFSRVGPAAGPTRVGGGSGLQFLDPLSDSAAGPTRVGGGSGRAGPVFEHTILGRIQLEISEDAKVKPAAEELLAKICERLTAAVASLSEPEREQLDREMVAADEGLERAERRLAELVRVRRDLWEAAAAADLPRADILDTIKHYEEEALSIEFSLAGLKARSEALTEQIAKIAQQMQAAPGTDPVAAELEKVVAVRERELEFRRVQQAAAVLSEREVGQAIENLALAKAELAKQRQAIAQAAGGDLLAEFNRDLVKLSIETAELEGRREFLQVKLAKVKERDLLELADRFEREVSLQLALAQTGVQAATERRDAVRHQLSTFRPPMVTVIGGK
ncbi:MAG TPA: hypothetical protein VM487_26430 [Phycisphaerae bacterium]|nr:hypothetical protein [Phycisphaerae bacterium]